METNSIFFAAKLKHANMYVSIIKTSASAKRVKGEKTSHERTHL